MLFRDVSIPFSLLAGYFAFRRPKIGFKDPEELRPPRVGRVTRRAAVFFLPPQVVTAKPSDFAKHTQCC